MLHAGGGSKEDGDEQGVQLGWDVSEKLRVELIYGSGRGAERLSWEMRAFLLSWRYAKEVQK